VKYKGTKLHNATIAIPQYAEEVFKDEVSFYLFFKDMTTKLREKIDKEHQRIFFERQDGSGRLVE